MSADTSIPCTQPTAILYNPLIYKVLQNTDVGRHLQKLHSANSDMMGKGIKSRTDSSTPHVILNGVKDLKHPL